MADNIAMLAMQIESLDENDEFLYYDETEPIAFALASFILGGFQRPRVANYVEDTVPLYSLDTFKTFFRLSRTTFERVLTILSECQELQINTSSGGRPPIPVHQDLLMHLWYMGSQECVRSIADRFDVSESTFVSHNRRMMDVLNDNFKDKLISWPPATEYQAIALEFERKKGFPGVIGAIDGSHIRIKAPAHHEPDYINRKRYHSIILQAVAREDRRIIDICVGWPGRVHDARVLKNSPLWNKAPQLCGQHHLLGDSAYPCRRWLMTPYKDNGNLTRPQKKYNSSQSGTRVIVENTFGILKGRFRRLQYIDMADVSYICKCIVAACVLHNVCVMGGDDVLDVFEDEDQEQFVGAIDNGIFFENDAEGPLKRRQLTRQIA